MVGQECPTHTVILYGLIIHMSSTGNAEGEIQLLSISRHEMLLCLRPG
jgi:hypothetical protein